MSLVRGSCEYCGRGGLAWWDGTLFELRVVPTGAQRGRAIVAVRRLNPINTHNQAITTQNPVSGALVLDVRDLPVEPPECYPQHRCSAYVSGGPRRVCDG